MTRTYSTTIVVAGSGPVGTSLAIEAGLRGVDVIVVEPRAADEPPSAKCNTVAARTMETFRRFGIAEKVRAAGLPDDYPTDTIYCTGLTGYELTRLRHPSRNERSEPGFDDSDWLTPEPMVRVSQLYLEPILRARMAEMPTVNVLNHTEVVRYAQDDDGVTVFCRTTDGEDVTIKARFLAGCDGGRSTVRKAMGVKLVGDAELGRTRTTLIRSAAVRDLFGDRRPAWMSWVVNDKVRGNVVAINGEDIWLVHRSLTSAHADYDDLDFDQSIRDVLGVGSDFTWEVLGHEDWVGRRLVAERFRDGNVFIAGDAAHLWVPFAGYGMNAGIADGVALAWVMCSVAKGWAPATLLDAYEAERLPITDQVSRFAMEKVLENTAAMGGGAPPPALTAEGPQGDAMRQAIGQVLHGINVPQFAPAGLNFGYFYDRSPIIAYDGEAAPSYDMGSVTPSTAPGCRMPHFWLGEGLSVYDRLGPDYTLVRFDPTVDVGALTNAAAVAGLPLLVIDVGRPPATEAFRHALLIVRQDQTVVWRGDAPPLDNAGLVDRLLGRFTTVASVEAPASSGPPTQPTSTPALQGPTMSIANLGYIGFRVSDVAAFKAFATNVLGVMVADEREGGVRFRVDSLDWRIAVEEGPENDIVFAGYEVAGAAELAEMSRRLTAAGVAVGNGDPALLKERGVCGMITCADPDGLRLEIYYGPTERTNQPFVSQAGVKGFVTGDQGVGHIVLATNNIDATRAFYTDLLGFRLSDIIRMQLSPEFGIDLEFFHCNPRHHTLALAPIPAPRKMHHFMLQVGSLDEVGFALERAEAAGAPITNTLGRHSNDQMVSFYARTPAGFEVEFGYGAIEVDVATWQVRRHDKMSSWGHKRLA
ncbi:FAD-dependent monooxygenase [Phenylobacterium sp.]|uniref:FAD-dependent monooxygenase n=1 Tax=Phenylobacterium sp. TaxID=1871053 RepID=UPI0025CD5568|nr:FAD-dependent monooxygenase [Phenylobacterium sp.]MBX3484289.1 FAD-dependent monooxygenase [Phenylobacterium sp.]MCW5758806.1 FAD-dependent monooxygenase [Phenylobacterium sp.]